MTVNPTPRILVYIAGDIRKSGGNARYALSLAKSLSDIDASAALLAQAWSLDSVDIEHGSDGSPSVLQKGINRVETNFAMDIHWLDIEAHERNQLRPLWAAYSLRVARPILRSLYLRLLKPIFVRWLKAHAFDTVVSINCGPIYLAEAMEAACDHLGITMSAVPLLHIDTTNEGCGPRYLKMYKRMFRVFTLTQFERNWLVAHGLDPTRVVTVRGGPDMATTENAMHTPQKNTSSLLSAIGNSSFILFLARKIPSKGYLPLLEASRQLADNFPDLKFVFAGVPTKEWDADFAQYRNAPTVIDMDVVSDIDRIELLKRCTILCAPSTVESFGMTYLEAWQYRKPVIAANTPVSQELVGGVGGGLVISPTPDAIQKAIIQLLNDRALREQFAENGFKAVSDSLNWPATARRYLAALAR